MISYRREDARRLVDRLGRTFKPDQLFLDVGNIEPGLDFVKVLSEHLQTCDVLLAVIDARARKHAGSHFALVA